MGSSSSKAARQLPKTGTTAKAPPPWAGARTSSSVEPQAKRPLEMASETRSAAIEQDAKDPHFLANLNRLGPVKVDHHMTTFKPAADRAQHVFETRLQSELDAQSPQQKPGTLLASALSDLLEERKAVGSKEELERLVKRYDVDVDRLERLAKYVNSPSVDPGSVKKKVADNGEESVEMKAVWTSPSL